MQYQIVLGGKTLSYELERKKVKNINLRVKPDGSIYVSAPKGVTIARVESLIYANEKRILSVIENAAKRAETSGEHKYEEGELFPVFGQWLPLKLTEGKSSARLENGAFAVTVKDCTDSELIRKTIEGFYRRECEAAALEACRKIYPAFAARGVAWPEIKFRFMKSRWGSCCPTEKRITLNNALAYTPLPCVEYVAAHEFCHFFQANHSKLFYAELERVIPDWKERKKLLNTFTAELKR